MRAWKTDDRGEALIGYALIVMLVGVVSIGALKTVGQSTSDTFGTISSAIPDSAAEIEPELTPREKWGKAKADYSAAIAGAKAAKKATVADAKTIYKAEVAANKSLAKAEKKAANKTAKTTYNDAKKQASSTYKASVSAAKSAKTTAKAEYKATK